MALGGLWAGWMVATPLRFMQCAAQNLAGGDLCETDASMKARIAERTDEIGNAAQGLMAVEGYMRDMSPHCGAYCRRRSGNGRHTPVRSGINWEMPLLV